MKKHKYLYTGNTWDAALLDKFWLVADKMAKEEFGFDYYDAEFHLIDEDTMCNLYASGGMPWYPDHWSVGQAYAAQFDEYAQGKAGLALEIVINSDPTINYLMLNNSATAQLMVMTHAGCGHGAVFKQNYLFKDNTDAKYINAYLASVQEYTSKCYAEYGEDEVSAFIDMLIAFSSHGYEYNTKKSPKRGHLQQQQVEYLRGKCNEASFDKIYQSLSKQKPEPHSRTLLVNRLHESDTNVLGVLKDYGQELTNWQQDLLTMFIKINTYFHPQALSKVLNEGWATFTHYTMMQEFYKQKLIDDSAYLEFIALHTSVINYQQKIPDAYRDAGFDYYLHNYGVPRSLNPYKMGFEWFMNLKRVCENPTKEDEKDFPEFCGTDWKVSLPTVMRNYDDKLFTSTFITPSLAKKYNLWAYSVSTHGKNKDATLIAVDAGAHNIDKLREVLYNSYNYVNRVPQLKVTYIDKRSNTVCIDARHMVEDPLDQKVPDTTAFLSAFLLHFKPYWGIGEIIIMWGIGEDEALHISVDGIVSRCSIVEITQVLYPSYVIFDDRLQDDADLNIIRLYQQYEADEDLSESDKEIQDWNRRKLVAAILNKFFK